MKTKTIAGILVLCLLHSFTNGQLLFELVHERGRLWENIVNDGTIGSMGVWDFDITSPVGFFPGFKGYTYPFGSENNAWSDGGDYVYSNANFHNFRSGCWILAKNLLTPGMPPDFAPVATDYEVYLSGVQSGTYGAEAIRAPLDMRKNFIEEPGFNPLLPEEYCIATWHTNTGISVTRYSYVWSYPGYRDFIIYDYHLVNTGQMVSVLTQELVPDFPEQDLTGVYFVFHSGIHVSTKSQINLYDDVFAIMVGGFGWKQPAYHDLYHIEDQNTLVYSTHINGGRAPTSWATKHGVKEDQAWKDHFGEELMSPAAFGWLALYASPTGATPRNQPTPDVLRIDSHKGGTFQGDDLNLEAFTKPAVLNKTFYDFAKTPDLQDALENGNRFNFYTLSYGPYSLAAGDSLRFIMAEIAGVMDYNAVIAGDTLAHPDSSIAAIRRNADLARNAVKWGMGVPVEGIPLAADAPEPPPAPNVEAINQSIGDSLAMIVVTWDHLAETVTIEDGSGGTFYNGLEDLDGYRIYRSNDFQYSDAIRDPVFRGAAWTLLKDIPKEDFADYWDAELGKYRYTDTDVEFGFRLGYYVSAYNSDPGLWTSANGTLVDDLPELESSDYNRSEPTQAVAGPVKSMDIYVAPNPYVYANEDRSFGISDPYKVEFRNLPEQCTIRIYTIAGDLIRTLEHQPDQFGNLSGTEAWDQKSESGLLVAPGMFIYHIETKTEGVARGAITGKLVLIR